MADLKKLTILHSNDMHGDFLAEEIDDDLVGGVSMLSGYLNKVRAAGSADQRKNLPARAGKFRLCHRGGVPPAAQSLDEPCRWQAVGPEWTEWIPE